MFLFPLSTSVEERLAPYLNTERKMLIASSLIKIGFTILAVLVAVFVPSFSFLCAVVGMICTMSVSIIFPAAAHLKMFGTKLAWYEKLLDSMLVVVGVVMAVVGTIVTLPQI